MIKNRRWTPAGKPGERVYAIGDIHGCLREVDALLNNIKRHNDYRDPAKTYLVFLGDLVDRGPNSRGVIERLISFPYEFAVPLFIKGNHEEMMVRSLMSEPHLIPDWLRYGGFACAESYGLSRRKLMGRDPNSLQRLLRSVIPRSHVEFLAASLDYVRFGDYLFTHAGIRPGVPIEKQKTKDLRWVREPFLSFQGDHGMVVVHGHTISERVETKHNRIGVDTGAYLTGKLSAICIDGADVTILSSKTGDKLPLDSYPSPTS
ncbi:MAG: metallophosphoesterase family protein [Pseudomonadota bacterium]